MIHHTYITADEAAQMRADVLTRLEPPAPVAKTFNVVKLEWTHWFVVPDHDARLHSHVEIPDTESRT